VSRTRSFGAIAVIIAALGLLMVKGLGNATEYFRTTDEAVAQVSKLGTKRFRLEGIVVADSICAASGGGVQFLVEENAKSIEVHHRGDPPELFRPDIPVVVSGRFDRAIASTLKSDAPVFASDLLMIKHSNVYVEKNKKRVKDYVGKDGVEAPAPDVPACK
jgi:cytochrome c-type biogenesis protein CcmE